MRVSVLGAGAWGTAMAAHAAARQDTVLWGRDPQQVDALQRTRENRRYLPGVALPAALQCTADLQQAVAHATPDGLLVLAVPLAALRALARQLAAQRAPAVGVLVLCKGFERETAALPHQVVEQVFADWPQHPAVGLLSGPSFADEVARGLPSALTVASRDASLLRASVGALHHDGMRVYASDDLCGVAVGGAVKNVLAIACGVSDGLEQGHNARAALITRGLAEMSRLGLVLGAQRETFTGLSGLGDLVLTCTGKLSRNRRVGLQLAAGKPLDAIVRELGHVAEGVYTARTLLELAERHAIDMPIAAAVGALLDGTCTAAEAVQALLAREPQPETRP